MLSAAKQLGRDVLRAGLKAIGDEPAVAVQKVEVRVLNNDAPGQIAHAVARQLVEMRRLRQSTLADKLRRDIALNHMPPRDDEPHAFDADLS